MDEHVRSLLITQQQVEAMFNLYRMGKHKKMTDGLKEVMVKWKQNTFKRAKARAELGLEAPKQTRSKGEVLSAFKRYKLDQMEQRAGASTLIARNWPHLLKWSRRRATSKEQAEAKEVKEAAKAARAFQKAEKIRQMAMMQEYGERPTDQFLLEQKEKWRKKAWPEGYIESEPPMEVDPTPNK